MRIASISFRMFGASSSSEIHEHVLFVPFDNTWLFLAITIIDASQFDAEVHFLAVILPYYRRVFKLIHNYIRKQVSELLDQQKAWTISRVR